MKSLSDFILRSPIVHINFAGFRATTHELTNHGWELSATQDRSHRDYGLNIQLLLRFEDICMVSAVNLIEHAAIINDPMKFMSQFNIMGLSFSGRSHFMAKMPEFSIGFMRSTFTPIDTTPQIERVDISQIDLAKYGIFKKLNDSANLFLPEKTINELMSEILEKQKPMQDEIRGKRQRASRLDGLFDYDRNPNEEIKLQLVAI